MNLDKVLFTIECVGATIASKKSQWYILGIKVIEYVYNKYGYYPKAKKVEKVLNQPTPENPTEVKGFVSLYIYYRIQIEGFV